MKKRKVWNENEVELLKKLYINNPAVKVAEIIGCSVDSVFHKAAALGLKKTEVYLKTTFKELGRKNAEHPKAIEKRFKKGMQVWNKGLKGTHFSKATEFRKGNLPANTLHDGAITIRTYHKNRGGKAYKWIRISKAKWQQYHKYIWEKTNGKVPNGYTLRFINGDSLDVRIENLQVISRTQQVRLNSNPEKAGKARKEFCALGKDLEKDSLIASYIAYGNPELQKLVIENKELIELKRTQLKLKRKINVIRKQTTENEGQELHVQNNNTQSVRL